jgi:hypothetical protein
MKPTEPPHRPLLTLVGSKTTAPLQRPTTEEKLVAVTFKGAYLSRENIEDLNTLFAIADAEKREGPKGKGWGAVQRLRDVGIFDLHYA